jgi:ubiquinone/menaquinone biosynthesis C-methylase UbiE
MTQYLKTDFDYNSDLLLEVFDELPLWAAPFGLKLLDHITYRKGIKALDIGFGAGFPLTELAMRLGKDSKIFGIDPWQAAVNRTKKKLGFYGIKNVELIEGGAEKIPLEDNFIDLICSNNGLNNVVDLNKSLMECSRVIKKGGQFIQTINLNTTMIEFYSIMENVLRELGLEKELVTMKEQIHKKRKPIEDYLGLIEKYGFEIKDVFHDQFEYKFVDGTTMLHHHFIRLAFIDGWKGIVPLERQGEVFERIENQINEQAAKEGIFRLRVPFVVINSEKNK